MFLNHKMILMSVQKKSGFLNFEGQEIVIVSERK